MEVTVNLRGIAGIMYFWETIEMGKFTVIRGQLLLQVCRKY
jgi:hypothetical protein